MRHWSSFGGRYKVENASSLLAANADGENLAVSYHTSFPTPYEVELTVECLRSNNGNDTLLGGFITGRMYGQKAGRVFWADTVGNRIGLAKPRLPPQSDPVKEIKSIRLKVNAFDGFYELFDRDGLGYASNSGFKDFEPGRIGVGHPPWVNVAGEIRFSDFRIRKLEFPGPLPASSPKARETYYLKRLENEKTYGLYFLLGMAQVDTREPLKAVKSFKAAEKVLPTGIQAAVNAAVLMRNMTQYEKARRNLERVLEKCVDDYAFQRPMVLNILIGIYASCPREKIRKGDKAVKYAEELLAAVSKEDLRWNELSTVAAAFAEAGQFEKAVQYAEQAIEVAKKTTRGDPGGLLYKLALYKDGKPFHGR